MSKGLLYFYLENTAVNRSMNRMSEELTHGTQPPPLPKTQPPKLSTRRRVVLCLAVLMAMIVLSLRPLGLIRPFKVPTNNMTPAMLSGDHIFAEKLTYWFRKPRRGDVLVFRTDGIADFPLSQSGQVYSKRLVGLPGETLHIEDGKLFVDGKAMPLSNAGGEIRYLPIPQLKHRLNSPADRFTVPADGYFVMGDNSTNSFDSRFWGVVPRENVIGRVWLRYWPLSQFGSIK